MKTARIFISSPGDVGAEREKAREIFDRLQVEFSGLLKIESYFWEHEPMRAHTDFQSQIEPPSKFDLFVCLLWARLGSRLHPGLHQKPGGGEYASGTEYELLDAMEGFRRSKAPEVLIYKRQGDPLIPAKPKEERERILSQYDALEAFFARLTQDDGHFVVGTNSYGGLEQFEAKFESDMRKVLERYVPEGNGAARAVPKTWTEGSPFRGLKHFDFEHAPIFFGRTRAIDEVLAALKQQAADERGFVLVFGGSGVGKSSLVRAGVLPWLVKPGVIDGVGLWRRGVMRPSEVNEGDLFDALAGALLRTEGLPEIGTDGTSAEKLASMLREKPDGVGMLIKGALSQAAREVQSTEKLERQPRALFALLIDQLEELFTVERLADQRESFLRAIDALARSGYVWVLATLRSDFYPRCEQSDLLMELKKGAGQYHLQPPDEVQLGQMIRLPAAAAGVFFQYDHKTGERLDDLLRDAAVKSPAALPLLEFALEELFEQREQETGRLTLKAYHDLGGVEGALGKRAEESFQSAGESAQESFDLVFRQLVTISTGEGEPAVRRRARKAEVEASAGARVLVDRLTADRLLVADRTEEGVVVISLAHEAMLASWPRLVQWVEGNRESLKIRAQVAADAQRWVENNRSVDYLYGAGLPLEKARAADRTGFLSQAEAEFVTASGRQVSDQATRRVKVLRYWLTAVGVLTVLVSLGAVIAFVAFRKAQAESGRAETALADNQRNLRNASMAALSAGMKAWEENLTAEQKGLRAETVGGLSKLHEAVAQFARALEFDEGNAPAARWLYDSILQRGLSMNDMPKLTLDINTTNPMRVKIELSGDGTKLAICGDRTVKIWSLPDGKYIGIPMEHPDYFGRGNYVESLSFSPTNEKLATVTSMDGVARLWDVNTGNALYQLGGEDENGISSVIWSGDGKKLLTEEGLSGKGGSIQVWDANSGEKIGEEVSHVTMNVGPWFSPDGARFFTIEGVDDETDVLEVHAASTGDLISTHNLGDRPSAVTLHPDGSRIAINAGNKLRVWDIVAAKWSSDPIIEEGNILGSAFSPDGSNILVLCKAYAGVWDVAEARRIAQWPNIPSVLGVDELTSDAVLSYSPDGTMLSCEVNRSTGVFDASTGALIFGPLKGGMAFFSADGCSLIKSDLDGHINVWDLPPRDRPITEDFIVQPGITRLSYSPDGLKIAAICSRTGRPSEAMVWSLSGGHPKMLLTTLKGHRDWIKSASFSSDGSRIVTASNDRTVRVWNATTGAPIGRLDNVFEDSAAFSADDSKIILRSSSRARVCQVVDGKIVELGSQQDILDCSPDGTTVLVKIGRSTSDGAEHQDMQLRDIATGKNGRIFDAGANSVKDARFSPNGKRIVGELSDSTAKVWDRETGNAIGEPMRTAQQLVSADFSPDGTKIVTYARGHLVSVWGADDGKHQFDANLGTLSPLGGDDYVEFSRDGTMLMTVLQLEGDITGAAIWDVQAGRLVSEPLIVRHRDSRRLDETTRISPDGSKIVFVDQSRGSVATLPPPRDLRSSGADLMALRNWANAISGLRFDGNSSLRTMPETERRSLVSGAALPPGSWSELSKWLNIPRADRKMLPGSRESVRQAAEHQRDFPCDRPATSLVAALRTDPTLPLARLLLAEAIEKEKANEPTNASVAARAAFLRKFDLDRLPADAILWARAAESLLNAPANARVGVGDQATPIIGEALKAAEEAVALGPKLTLALRQKARTLSRLDRDAEALDVWQMVLKQPDAEAKDFCDAGYAAASLHHNDIARVIFERALAKFPVETRIPRMQGWSFLHLNDPVSAVANFERCRTLLGPARPPDEDLLGGLSIAYWLNEQKEEAIASFKLMIKASPKWVKPEAISALDWPLTEKKPLEEVRLATLARHPDLAAGTAK